MQTKLYISLGISALVILSGCTQSDTQVTNSVTTSINKSSDITTSTTNTISSGINYSVVDPDSDFIPPFGRAVNPPPASAGERRLLLATSTDGIHFTANGEVLTDQGNVPDMIVEPDGTIRVYYIGQSIETNKEESTVVAISEDNGASWTFRKLTYTDWPQPRDPSDPDVVLLEDGTYRMYYTSSLQNNTIGIVYATSPDGITFTYQGESLEGDTGNIIDSSTFLHNGVWHMYVLQEKVPGQLHATSTDGLTFTLTAEPEVQVPAHAYVLSNQILGDDGIHMFGFSLPENNIRLFTSSDGITWDADEIALEGDTVATLGSNYIQDSTIAKLVDGTYLMVYVSEIPE